MLQWRSVLFTWLFVFSFTTIPAFSDSSQVATQAAAVPMTPDPQVTPGDVCDTSDPDFTGYRYEQRIAYCVRNVDTETKAKIYETYGIAESQRRFYTIDHFIPLSIGGSNQDSNLWPEHRKIKQTRLTLEQEIYEAVKVGELSQERAIRMIVDAKMNPAPIDP